MQRYRFRDRVRNTRVHEDIEAQIEKNHHGKGGVKRSIEKHGLEQKRMAKGRSRRKNPPPTPVEAAAIGLAHSAWRRFAKCPLNQPHLWPDPDPKFPEVCFVGRSNVGKSSLLNKIATYGTVAPVSAMPGKTKHVTWYRNRKIQLSIIDMPGYGHAERAKLFGPEATAFVKARTSIVTLYVLIDARHGFKQTDLEWLSELSVEGPVKQIILTKCDLLSRKKLSKMASLVRSDLEGMKRVENKLLLCSSRTEAGIQDLRVDICRRCDRRRDKPVPKGIISLDMPQVVSSSPTRLGIMDTELRSPPRGRDTPAPEEDYVLHQPVGWDLPEGWEQKDDIRNAMPSDAPEDDPYDDDPLEDDRYAQPRGRGPPENSRRAMSPEDSRYARPRGRGSPEDDEPMLWRRPKGTYADSNDRSSRRQRGNLPRGASADSDDRYPQRRNLPRRDRGASADSDDRYPPRRGANLPRDTVDDQYPTRLRSKDFDVFARGYYDDD